MQLPHMLRHDCLAAACEVGRMADRREARPAVAAEWSGRRAAPQTGVFRRRVVLDHAARLAQILSRRGRLPAVYAVRAAHEQLYRDSHTRSRAASGFTRAETERRPASRLRR